MMYIITMQANDSGLASYVAGQIDRTLSWKDVKWLQTITSMPILVKGVITAEDSKNTINLQQFFNFIKIINKILCLLKKFAARLAIQAGAAGIIVSNHGARQLDYVPATIMALEEVFNFSIYFIIIIIIYSLIFYIMINEVW